MLFPSLICLHTLKLSIFIIFELLPFKVSTVKELFFLQLSIDMKTQLFTMQFVVLIVLHNLKLAIYTIVQLLSFKLIMVITEMFANLPIIVVGYLLPMWKSIFKGFFLLHLSILIKFQSFSLRPSLFIKIFYLIFTRFFLIPTCLFKNFYQRDPALLEIFVTQKLPIINKMLSFPLSITSKEDDPPVFLLIVIAVFPSYRLLTSTYYYFLSMIFLRNNF